MTYIVTGGAGFIGSALCRFLMEKRPEIRLVCVDKLTYAGSKANIAGLCGSRFRFVRADVADREAMERLFSEEKPKIVINLAAESHVDRSIGNPQPFLHSNVIGAEVLMECCLKYGAERFHQVSTDEVYGDVPLSCNEPFTEESPLRPSNPYAASKASADLLALAFYRTYGLNVTISRCANNFGVRQYPEKLIPVVIKCALEGKKAPVYGDGQNVRQWIFVDDHCRAIDLIAEKGTAGQVYNVGGGTSLSNLELVKKLLVQCGADENAYEFVADRKGHDRKYLISGKKLQKELGFQPEADFEKALAETVRWYLGGKNQ